MLRDRYLNALARKLKFEIKTNREIITENFSSKNFLISLIYCYRMLENIIKFWREENNYLREDVFNSLLEALKCLDLMIEVLRDTYGIVYDEKFYKDNIESFKTYLHEEYNIYRTQLNRAIGLPEKFRKDSLLILRGVSILSRKFKNTITRLEFMPTYCRFLEHISSYKIVVEEALN